MSERTDRAKYALLHDQRGVRNEEAAALAQDVLDLTADLAAAREALRDAWEHIARGEYDVAAITIEGALPAREAVLADTPEQDSGSLASSLGSEHGSVGGASEDVSK